MALVLTDRVQQTGTANTTVSFTLSGSVTGFQSFTAGVGDGNTTYYAAYDASGNWEVGLGTYSTIGPTLTRTTVYASSNSGSAVTFSGTVNVFVTYAATKSVYEDDSNNVTLPANLTFSNTGNRIIGDLDSVTIANRVFFQTNTVNGISAVSVIPNGTGTTGSFHAYNNSNPTNSSFAQVSCNSSNVIFSSNTRGSGTQLPIVFNTAGVVQLGITHTASAVNYLSVTGGTTTNAPVLSTVGTDTNINLNLTPKGTGNVVATTGAFSGTHIGTWTGSTIGLAYGGTGATSAPAAMAALMGFTTTATAAGTTVLTNTSSYYQIFTGTNTQTITLPVTSTLAQGWTFHICNNSTGNLTVNSSGGNLVLTVVPGTTVMVTCILTSGTDAASWEAGYTDFSTLTGTGSVVLSASPTLTGTTTIATLSPSTIADASVLARNAGKTANTTINNTTTYTTGGVTLASQTAAANAVWRVSAFGQYTAASSGTARTARVACFWGSTQLTAITPTVLTSTAQTTQWQCEFTLTASSTTAIWTAGTMISRVASATALAMDNATAASTAVTAGAQTLDLRFSMSSATPADSWVVQSVTLERLE